MPKAPRPSSSRRAASQIIHETKVAAPSEQSRRGRDCSHVDAHLRRTRWTVAELEQSCASLLEMTNRIEALEATVANQEQIIKDGRELIKLLYHEFAKLKSSSTDPRSSPPEAATWDSPDLEQVPLESSSNVSTPPPSESSEVDEFCE